MSALSTKDVNAPLATANEAAQKPAGEKAPIKSMEYHRQVLQSKIDANETHQYISPSDNIMSPCTAKLNAFRNKQVGKAKPKSLFAQASSKKLSSDNLFGAPKDTTKP